MRVAKADIEDATDIQILDQGCFENGHEVGCRVADVGGSNGTDVLACLKLLSGIERLCGIKPDAIGKCRGDRRNIAVVCGQSVTEGGLRKGLREFQSVLRRRRP